MEILLGVIATVLVVAGIVTLLRKQVLWGFVLIAIGLVVGPGGISAIT
jgi:hypothetical protein